MENKEVIAPTLIQLEYSSIEIGRLVVDEVVIEDKDKTSLPLSVIKKYFNRKVRMIKPYLSLKSDTCVEPKLQVELFNEGV